MLCIEVLKLHKIDIYYYYTHTHIVILNLILLLLTYPEHSGVCFSLMIVLESLMSSCLKTNLM